VGIVDGAVTCGAIGVSMMKWLKRCESEGI